MLEVKAFRRDNDHNMRGVSRVPSGEMDTLTHLVPGLWSESRGALCEASPQNFIGSLLLFVRAEKFMDIFHAEHLVPPRSYKTPVKLVDNIRLQIWNQQQTRYEPVWDDIPEAKHVGPALIKKACGNMAAVVLEGPFAGLICSVHKGKGRSSQIFCVNRAWNDYSLKVKLVGRRDYYCSPYSPDTPSRRNTRTVTEAEIALELMFKTLGDQLYWASLTFFHLLTEAGIAFDREAFHMTRQLMDED